MSQDEDGTKFTPFYFPICKPEVERPKHIAQKMVYDPDLMPPKFNLATLHQVSNQQKSALNWVRKYWQYQRRREWNVSFQLFTQECRIICVLKKNKMLHTAENCKCTPSTITRGWLAWHKYFFNLDPCINACIPKFLLVIMLDLPQQRLFGSQGRWDKNVPLLQQSCQCYTERRFEHQLWSIQPPGCWV